LFYLKASDCHLLGEIAHISTNIKALVSVTALHRHVRGPGRQSMEERIHYFWPNIRAMVTKIMRFEDSDYSDFLFIVGWTNW
jgi:hypothetical protein